MHVTRNGIDTAPGPDDWFTGAVYIDSVAAPADGSRLSASSVHFTPGARTAWHTHPNGQSIYVIEGICLCQSRGGPIDWPRGGPEALVMPKPYRPADVVAAFRRLRGDPGGTHCWPSVPFTGAESSPSEPKRSRCG